MDSADRSLSLCLNLMIITGILSRNPHTSFLLNALMLIFTSVSLLDTCLWQCSGLVFQPSLISSTHSPITHSTFWWRCYLQLWWYFFYIIHPSIKNTIWKSSLMFLTKFLQSLSKQWHSTSGWPKPVQSSWHMTQNHVLKARMLWSVNRCNKCPMRECIKSSCCC